MTGGCGMKRYYLSKLGQAIITITLVVLVVFALLRFMPTAGYFSKEQWKDMSEPEKTAYLRSLGVLDPLLVQLRRFVTGLFSGDLGRSIVMYPNMPIASVLGDKMAHSLLLNLLSWFFSALIGMPLGLAMASRKGGLTDKLGTLYVVIIRAVPSIIIHFFIQIYCSRWLGLPLLFYLEQPISWILPILSMSIGSIAGYGVWLRRYIVDEENKDYIKFARVKGLSQRYIMWRHVLRNAMLPIVTSLGMSVSGLIGGSVVIEQIFNWNGMGTLFLTANNTNDYPLMMGIMLFLSSFALLANLVTDLLYSLLDPRVSAGGGRR